MKCYMNFEELPGKKGYGIVFTDNKLDMINKEIEYLKKIVDNYSIENELLDELMQINEKLWVIEDNIRVKEQRNEFDAEFISLARQVYITNDKRSETKNKINKILNSEIFEIKSYEKFN